MSSSIILYLLAFCSSALATGHLRLEFTPSSDCDLLLATDFYEQSIELRLGEKRTTSFHPRNGAVDIHLVFSIGDGLEESMIFPLEISEKPHRHVLKFSKAVLIEYIFQCDTGYYGPQCMIKVNPTTRSSTISTTTTTSTSTTTVATTSTATEKVSPSTIPVFSTSSTALIENETPLTDVVVIVLIIVIAVLLVIIAIVFILLLPRQQHVYIGPICESPEMAKSFEDSQKADSRCLSPESVRYTAAPYTLNISP